MKNQLSQILTRNFINDEFFNNIPEYKELAAQIYKTIKKKKTDIKVYKQEFDRVKREINKITIFGFDAIIIFVKIQKALEESIVDFEELENYEACSVLKDILDIIQNQLYNLDEG